MPYAVQTVVQNRAVVHLDTKVPWHPHFQRIEHVQVRRGLAGMALLALLTLRHANTLCQDVVAPESPRKQQINRSRSIASATRCCTGRPFTIETECTVHVGPCHGVSGQGLTSLWSSTGRTEKAVIRPRLLGWPSL